MHPVPLTDSASCRAVRTAPTRCFACCSSGAAYLYLAEGERLAREPTQHLTSDDNLSSANKHGGAPRARKNPVGRPSYRRPPWPAAAPLSSSAGGGSIGLQQHARAGNQDGHHQDHGT